MKKFSIRFLVFQLPSWILLYFSGKYDYILLANKSHQEIMIEQTKCIVLFITALIVIIAGIFYELIFCDKSVNEIAKLVFPIPIYLFLSVLGGFIRDPQDVAPNWVFIEDSHPLGYWKIMILSSILTYLIIAIRSYSRAIKFCKLNDENTRNNLLKKMIFFGKVEQPSQLGVTYQILSFILLIFGFLKWIFSLTESRSYLLNFTSFFIFIYFLLAFVFEVIYFIKKRRSKQE